MVVGVTGGIGSGKSTVVKFFSEFENIAIYIADIEAKKLMNNSSIIKTQLIAEFSEKVYQNNELNRKFLADIVFSDKQKLAVLNSIVHPEVHKHFQEFVVKNKHKDYVLYENAILFENGSDVLCDKIIMVTAPLQVRIQRVIDRDAVTKKDVENRIRNQWEEDKKILQSHYLIENIDLQQTRFAVCDIHKKLTKKQCYF